MKRLSIALLITALFLTACATAETEPPAPTITPLPTAVPPETLPGTWAVPFGTGFRGGFWAVGTHRYSLTVDCPSDLQDIEGNWNSFEVTDNVAADSNPIFLRLGGLSTNPFSNPGGFQSINPAQETVAYVTLLGLDEEAVQDVVAGCEIFMFFDAEETPFQLQPLEPYQA
ncbi:MAG: hypothetical protein DWQ07_12980 [Chloroflexi bacterium]|nr:MAG: hypothetical protein DWQ07_12980 [Chloroflexota bacterium]MBL1196954.1 hypothetical protein [Chloroflexota bacterium]NOH14250.1 hypothetical protein [Chloroflexota bacterium]